MKVVGLKALAKINDQGVKRAKNSEFEVTQERYKEIKAILKEKTDIYLQILYIKTL